MTRITTHVNDAGVQKPIDHHGYDYDALDYIQKQTSITGASWKYGYNSTGEVTTAVQKMPNTTTDYFGRNYRYRYDGIGNRTSVEQSKTGAQASRLFSYSPNALNQYTTHTHPDFLDVTGMANPLAAVTVNGLAATRQLDYFYKEISKTNTSNPQWLQSTISDGTTTSSGALSLPAMQTSPSYDADGNLTADSEWIYTWDAENRLTRIERTAAAIAAGAPYHRELHDYDYRSRRIRTRIFANTGTTPSSHVLYIFDGWKCVAELSSSGMPLRKYTWGLDLAGSMGDTTTGNVGALLWLVDTPTAKTHIHLYDKNGNVTGLLDTTTRKRSATYAYDAFGQLITCYGDYAKLNPFTYSTKFTDHTTSLRYYGYRWYGAKDGRWLSRDPIGEKGGVNLYGFVGNNGVDNIDKLGREITVINDGADALAYWRSNLGGTIEAGEFLTINLEYSIPFLNSRQETVDAIEKQIIDLGRGTLCGGLSGMVYRKGRILEIVNFFDFSVGSFNLSVSDYQVVWKNEGSTLGFSKITFTAERKVTFSDEYVFNGHWYNPKTWIQDNLPEVVAGPGTPFFITGGWVDHIRGKFSICCWGN